MEDIEQDESDEQPEVINRNGILVVRAKATRDLTNVVKEERERRVQDLIGRMQG